MSSDPKEPVRRLPGTVAFTDGFLSMQSVWVVIRRNPDRFKVFLSRDDARAVMKHGDELWSRHMYESADGSINNWSNFVQEQLR